MKILIPLIIEILLFTGAFYILVRRTNASAFILAALGFIALIIAIVLSIN